MNLKRVRTRFRNDFAEGGILFTVLPVPASAWIASFGGHPSQFLISKSACCNPECTCRELAIDFDELDAEGHRRKSGLKFMMYLNVDRFVEMPTTDPRPLTARPLIEEFLRELTAEDKATLRCEFEETRKTYLNAQRNLARLNLEEAGARIPGIRAFGEQFCLIRMDTGYDYALFDAYCSDPECTCRDVTIQVWGAKSDALDAKNAHICTFRSAFETTFDIERIVKGTETEATALCQSLLGHPQTQEWSEIWQWRSRLVRGIIAHRTSMNLGRSGMLSTPVPLKSPARPGPNQPCPCGSGRKYKKCCGRGG